MTLQKAIEILTYMTKSTNVASLEDCIDAIKLGIEALNRIQTYRREKFYITPELLPGETEG